MSDGVKRALVTGASAGIGRACAEELHAAGWAVTGASRRGTTSGGWPGLVMDVDDDDSVRTGVSGVLAAGGRIDALVASAGLLAKRLLPFRAFGAAAKSSLGV
jgi:NAD(P)-dependent dehydrogenase (short-subunit alcohol dehydrogenase family)